MPIRRALLVSLLGGVLTSGVAAAPAAADSRYTRCADVPGTALVMVARTACEDVLGVATAVATVTPADGPATLRRAGWTPYRAERSDTQSDEYDIVALRGSAVLRVRRRGVTPDLDGLTAGRELVFARGRIVGGRPVPSGAALCTSAFLVRFSSGSLGALSAAHCAGERRDGRVARRNAAMRRPPSPGIALGGVQRYVARSAPLDALVLPVPRSATRSVLPVVDRGITRPPWIVAGTARTISGRDVCYAGRTSGADRCGVIRGARGAERILALQSGLVVRCTSVSARQGDSGGPVYTAPRADGTVRALGITTLVVGRRAAMCFTPVAPVLDRLKARLLVG